MEDGAISFEVGNEARSAVGRALIGSMTVRGVLAFTWLTKEIPSREVRGNPVRWPVSAGDRRRSRASDR